MSDVSKAIVIFLGATLVLHSAYLIPHCALHWSPPKWVWIVVDYVWISVLLVTLIRAAAEARVYFAPGPLRTYEGRVQTDFTATQGLARDYRLYFCDLADDKNWPVEAGPAAFQRGCAWFTEMTDALEGAYDSMDWSPFLEKHRQELPDDDRVVQSAKEEAISSLERLQEDYAAVEEQRQKAIFSLPEDILVAVWPFLLAVSLALRVTKATAELVEQSTWAANNRSNTHK